MTNALRACDVSDKMRGVAVNSIDVSELRSGEEENWNRYVNASPSATFFHLVEWRTIIEKVLGRQCFYLAARRGGQISGVLPISRVRSRLFGDCLVSLPLAVYGGICADDQDSNNGLLQAGSDQANRLGVKYLELRNRTEPFPTSFTRKDLYVTFTGSFAWTGKTVARPAAGYPLCGSQRAEIGARVDRRFHSGGVLRVICAERAPVKDAGFPAAVVHAAAERIPETGEAVWRA
jgi:hypothetical protein